MATDNAIFDQYSGVRRLLGGLDGAPSWITSDLDKARIAAYMKYEEIYFNDDRAFQLMRRGTELEPIMVPNAKTVCDTTAHYLMKGVAIEFKGKAQDRCKSWLKKQKFASKFAIAKHSGVVRGDYVFHLTVNEEAPEGERVLLISVDPAAYFPIHDPDDLDNRIGVTLAEMFIDDDGEERIKKRTYRIEKVGSDQRVSVEEVVYENQRRLFNEKLIVNRVIQPMGLLPSEITHIPVYHFKNADWQGQAYGSSELRGFERILGSINQTISDEELALALEGLGVYATDAGAPRDDQGNEQPWEIAPARVMEIPSGSMFKRVEGINSVKPMLDHVQYLGKSLYEASATFLAGEVEAQVAESGIALAIKFLPTQAKIEERDLAGMDELTEMFIDWTFWEEAYEGESFGGDEPTLTLGSKLPLNREERVAELNNMLDRNVISRAFYRTEMNKLGYEIPDDIQDEIDEELANLAQFKLAGGAFDEPQMGPDGRPLPSGNPSNPNQPTLPKPASTSNNKGRVNESKGTETGQSLKRQANGRR